MEEIGDDKLEPGEKDAIEAAIGNLEVAMKTDDATDIEAKTKALGEASGKMAERLYAQKAQDGQAGAEGAAGAEASGDAGADDVVDAEFEEVDEAKK